MEDHDYLAHHGIPGQSWGVRNGPPYPLTAQKVAKVKKALAKRKKEKAAEKEKARRIAKRKATIAKAEKQVRDHEKLKEHIRRKPKDFYKYRDMLTKEEANALIEQIQWDRKIDDIRFDEFKRFNARVKEVGSAIQNASNIMNQGISLYNNTALIYNAIADHQARYGSWSTDEANKHKMKQIAWKDEKKGGENS